MALKITILGAGGSLGTPLVGGHWGACDPANPRNLRSRPGVLVETEAACVLIDAGPDLRYQLLRERVTRAIDTLLLTHEHADHTAGLDDLRAPALLQRRAIPIYGNDQTIASIQQRFPFLFGQGGQEGYYDRPFFAAHVIAAGQGVSLPGGLEAQSVLLDHAVCPVLGYRLGGFALATDVRRMPDLTIETLKGVEVLVVSCLRKTATVAHAAMDEVLDWIERIGPRKAYLTHMDSSLDYAETLAGLPPGVEPAYDGLVVSV